MKEKVETFFKKITNFLREVSLEIRRITWPERRELVDSTTVCIVFIVIIAVVVMCCDEIIRTGLGLIFG